MSQFEGEELAAWLRARCGFLTASNAWKAMDYLKGGKPSSTRATHQRELLAERLTGDSVRHFVTAAMQWGLDHEDDAKAAYEAATGNLITDVGFFHHPTIEYFGATPDGRIEDGLGEFKCPTSTTHVGWLMDGIVPEQHRAQMCAQMLCTGTDWCEFISYDPRMRKPEHRLFIIRYTPTPEELAKVEAEAKKFLDEVEKMFEVFTEGYRP